MMRSLLNKAMAVALLAAATSLVAPALSTARYATTSRLATGNWVKISVPESGMYQITDEQLLEMGFSDPEKVAVYGFGGYPISEVLDGKVGDDLTIVPARHTAGKLIFFGCGPVKYSMVSTTSDTQKRFERSVNTYANAGYYFLGEGDGPVSPTMSTRDIVGSDVLSTGYTFVHHEQDLINVGMTGKTFLGEPIRSGKTWSDVDQLWVDMHLSDLRGDLPVMVQTSAAALCKTALGYVSAYVRSSGQTQEVPYTSSASRIFQASAENSFFNQNNPYLPITLTEPSEDISICPFISTPYSDGGAEYAYLDYLLVTYQRDNGLKEHSQVYMGEYNLTTSNVIFVPEASSTLEVWNIDTPSTPVRMKLSAYTHDEVTGVAFAPQRAATTGLYVVFDPTLELKSIGDYKVVANQNLHGMETPDMLIVTCAAYREQAERVAQLHRDIDGMTVAVVDQEEAFNEFSSGTPDAMAIRMLCKMFYDRDNTKFRYLLMLGAGSYDNRGITGKRENVVITYESTSSVREDESYACDDFYGFLADNSGYDPATDLLSIGVGRIPGSTLAQITSDVDKLEEYLTSEDYGVWRNNMMVACDAGDNDLHMFQAEQSVNLLSGELNTGLIANRVYNDEFARAINETWTSGENDPRTASEAKKRWSELSKDGMYFMTYIGHAGPTTYTKVAHMWTMSDVSSTVYKRMPIMTTACCDVARYDGGVQGIAEQMFHKRDGGAIALLTSCRAVYATDNDNLNRAFMRAMFAYEADGAMPRLGDAYKAAKRSFGTNRNTNKMAFLLLGDPAIQINYPKPLMAVTKLGTYNTADINNYVTCYPLQQYTIESVVYKPGTTEVDESFNGDATLTIYDKQRTFKSNVAGRVDAARDTINIYYSRNKLAVVEGRVENGVFSATVTLPRYAEAHNENLLVSAYAHRDNSTEMVNGSTNKLRLGLYDESKASEDNDAPVVEQMYFAGHENEDLPQLGTTAPIHIVVTDDTGLNVQNHSIGNKMSLSIDGGAMTVADINTGTVLSDGSRKAVIDYTITDMQAGDHTAEFVAYDMHGNRGSRTVSFVVVDNDGSDLSADSDAVTSSVNFDFNNATGLDVDVTVKVLDITGNLVWSTTASEFPVAWNLQDKDGNAVAPGLYKYFGTYRGTGAYGGTSIKNIIVLPAVQ